MDDQLSDKEVKQVARSDKGNLGKKVPMIGTGSNGILHKQEAILKRSTASKPKKQRSKRKKGK
jgi:hypothetical protein